MPATLALQLYSVRDPSERDFLGTLERLAEAGYEGVELAGLHGHKPEAVRAALDRLRLRPVGAHVGLEAIEADPDAVAGQAEALGYTRIVVPWAQAAERAELDRLLDRLRQACAALGERGLSLGYHNHAHEFDPLSGDGDGGGGGVGRMMDEIERVEGLFLELDLGWVWYAGHDPLGYYAERAQRTPLVHVKDFTWRPGLEPAREGEDRFCPVGEGRVGYAGVVPGVLEHAPEAIILEQDHAPGRDQLDDAIRSIENARRWLA